LRSCKMVELQTESERERNRGKKIKSKGLVIDEFMYGGKSIFLL